ncbi:hypothetical protein J4206_03895 [Candidatus Woesearchaeota archaeon]|nr:hypothetical protein [Candidatus Woesearchaeota archaeon]
MLKFYTNSQNAKNKHLAVVKRLRMLSKKYSSALKTSSASKFYQQQSPQKPDSHNISQIHLTQAADVSKFSSVLYSKDKTLHVINSKIIENLNWQYNSYTQIENACIKISEKYIGGTFYLYNNYPLLSGLQNSNQKNEREKLFANNKLSSQNKKIARESNLMMQFFS